MLWFELELSQAMKIQWYIFLALSFITIEDEYKCNFSFLSINSLLQNISGKRILSEQELIYLLEHGLSDIRALSDDRNDVSVIKSEEGRAKQLDEKYFSEDYSSYDLKGEKSDVQDFSFSLVNDRSKKREIQKTNSNFLADEGELDAGARTSDCKPKNVNFFLKDGK